MTLKWRIKKPHYRQYIFFIYFKTNQFLILYADFNKFYDFNINIYFN
jgi:hypothetical protein